MSAPERVFLDERVAFGLPETTAEAQECIGQDVNVIAYIREDVHLEAVRVASSQGQEFVVQIQALSEQCGDVRVEHLVALTTAGRMFERKGPDWVPVDLPELET